MPFPTRSLRDEIDPLTFSIWALLVVTFVAQLAWPTPAPSLSSGRPATPLPPAPQGEATPNFPGILARPLFNPARGAAGASEAASTQLSDYTLVGVASVGGRGLAVFKGPGGAVATLRVGQALLGWRVSRVGADGVTLAQGDVRRDVPVSASAAGKTGAP